MPYANKRSTVIGRYLQKFLLCQIDAVYSVRGKENKNARSGYLKRWQDYEQIYRDFNLTDPDQILEQCLVIACYTAELDFDYDADMTDLDMTDVTNIKNPEM